MFLPKIIFDLYSFYFYLFQSSPWFKFGSNLFECNRKLFSESSSAESQYRFHLVLFFPSQHALYGFFCRSTLINTGVNGLDGVLIQADCPFCLEYDLDFFIFILNIFVCVVKRRKIMEIFSKRKRITPQSMVYIFCFIVMCKGLHHFK